MSFAALSLLSHLFASSHLQTRTKSVMYTQLIRPVYTYAFPVWCSASATTWKNLFGFERRCLRSVTGLWQRFDTPELKYHPNATLYKRSMMKRSLSSHFLRLTERIHDGLVGHDNPFINSFLADLSPITAPILINPLNFVQAPDDPSPLREAIKMNNFPTMALKASPLDST